MEAPSLDIEVSSGRRDVEIHLREEMRLSGKIYGKYAVEISDCRIRGKLPGKCPINVFGLYIAH